MRKQLLLVFFLILFCAPRGSATEYLYDQEHSRVSFSVKHFGLVTLGGYFEKFSGNFLFDTQQIKNTFVRIQIDTNSVRSKNTVTEQMLRSTSFFWSEKHPVISFESKEIQKIMDKRFDIHGDLTIRGITKPAIFHTELCCEVTDEDGQTRLLFHSYTIIKRKDYDIGKGSLLDTVGFLGREELKIELEIKGVRKDPEADILKIKRYY